VAGGDELPVGRGDQRVIEQLVQCRLECGGVVGDLVDAPGSRRQVGEPGGVGDDQRAASGERGVRGLRGADQLVLGVPEHDRVGAAQPVVKLPPGHPPLSAVWCLGARGRLEGPAVSLADRRDDLLARAPESECPHDRGHVAHAEADHVVGRPDAEAVCDRRVEAVELELAWHPVVVPGDHARALEALEQLEQARQVVEPELELHVQHVEPQCEDALDVQLVVTVAVPVRHVEAGDDIVLVGSERALVVVARAEHDQLDLVVARKRLHQRARVLGDPALRVPAREHADLHGVTATIEAGRTQHIVCPAASTVQCGRARWRAYWRAKPATKRGL
jgi:hypothetical protein